MGSVDTSRHLDLPNVVDRHGNEMVVVPAHNVLLPDGTRFTHDSFMIDKYIASQPDATKTSIGSLWDYGAALNVGANMDPGNAMASSKQGVVPWAGTTYARQAKACQNRGREYVMASNMMWAMLGYWAKEFGVTPHGDNENSIPPRDAEYPSETGVLDSWLGLPLGQGGGYPTPANYRALVGSGPSQWACPRGRESGIYDMNGLGWERVMGLWLQAATGFAYVQANTRMSMTKGPLGQSSAVVAGQLYDEYKEWTADEFLDGTLGTFVLVDGAGTFHNLANGSPANNTNTLFLANAATVPAEGCYQVLRLISTDITAGMVSGNKILTMQTDAVLRYNAIPATTNATGSKDWGQDIYFFSTGALRCALRGGRWDYGVGSGVSSLILNYLSTDIYVSNIAFRCAKLL